MRLKYFTKISSTKISKAMDQPCTRGDLSSLIPGGLKALMDACHAVYPDQKYPLEASTLVKYWGDDPKQLAYIYIFYHREDSSTDTPAHWHYVTFGLTDLYGDGNLFPPNPTPDSTSGFGFEMTFRLKQSMGETTPPVWPAIFLHDLAKRIFKSNKALWAGDNITWHCPLDDSSSRIEHMLMSNDPQLGGPVPTVHGRVYFMQLVGVTFEELRSAQWWSGGGVARLLKKAFGPLLVTDMQRKVSLFEVDSAAQLQVNQGMESEGSELTAHSTCCSWHLLEEDEACVLERKFQQISIQEVLQKELDNCPIVSKQQNDMEVTLDGNDNAKQMLGGVLVRFTVLAGVMLSLVLRGRLRHGRSFTYESCEGDGSITLLPKGIPGAMVSEECPLVCHGTNLEVLIIEEDIQEAVENLDEWAKTGFLMIPKTFEWCKGRLRVIVANH